ncbi:hypothetical protein D3C79_998740 [compost metagenome]
MRQLGDLGLQFFRINLIKIIIRMAFDSIRLGCGDRTCITPILNVFSKAIEII